MVLLSRLMVWLFAVKSSVTLNGMKDKKKAVKNV
jgi:hypothetical protein